MKYDLLAEPQTDPAEQCPVILSQTEQARLIAIIKLTPVSLYDTAQSRRLLLDLQAREGGWWFP